MDKLKLTDEQLDRLEERIYERTQIDVTLVFDEEKQNFEMYAEENIEFMRQTVITNVINFWINEEFGKELGFYKGPRFKNEVFSMFSC